MGKKRISITGSILNMMLWFSVISVIRGLQAFENINKIWIALLSGILLLRMVFYKYTVRQVMVLYITILIHVIALYFTDFPLYHFNILFYFLLWMLIYVFFSKSRGHIESIMEKKDGDILIVLWVWTLVVGISALLPSCYSGLYFLSFAGSSFRLMPAVLIIQALAMYMAISRNDHRYEWFLVLPTYAGFMNASRTYFVVYILFMIMYLYMRMKSKRDFYLMLIPVIGIILLVMSVSGITDKIQVTQYTENSYFDYWGTISNGRTVFWRWDLEAFFDLPLWKQFVGNGFNFAYEVTDFYGGAIWAHNDIINLLMNFGYTGVALYLWAYFHLVGAFLPKGNGVPRMVRFLFHAAVWFNSMMNMSYTYLCAVIAYPLFLCAIAKRYGTTTQTKLR